MFRVTDNAIRPHKATFSSFHSRVDDAHRKAIHAGVSHVHQRLVEAAENAGLDASPLDVFYQNNVPFVGIDGEKDTGIGDVEFGTHENPPNPILRTAAFAAHHEANQVYGQVFNRELGT